MDREDAARDRAEALRSRSESNELLDIATTDELTGAWTRGFGIPEVSRELERAHRTGSALVLAFIDVDQPKALNDSEGHAAGDALLRLIGQTLRANLRPYDVLVRYGGDELICAMPNVKAGEAHERFQKVAAALATRSDGQSISFGLAEARVGDSVQALVERADSALLEQRRSRRS